MTEPISQEKSIRRRPGLYFGTKSLTALHHFYNGYNMAFYRNPGKDAPGHPLIDIPRDFHDWVAYRTHHEFTSGWCGMIVATTGSEEEAFDRFFCLLDEYRNRREKIIAEIHDPEPCMSSLNSMTMEATPVPPPKMIRIVTYTDDPGFFTSYTDEQPFYRNRFHRYMSTIRELKGGKIEVIDEETYRRFKIEDEAWFSQL